MEASKTEEVPSTTDPLEKLKWIESLVRRFLGRLPLDHEGLAVDIWLEGWEKHREVTWVNVRCRCVDQIRQYNRGRHREVTVELVEETVSLEAPETSSHAEYSEEVERVMGDERLTPQDKMLVWWKFYKDEGFEEIGRRLGLGKEMVRLRLQKVLAKMRDIVAEGVPSRKA